MDSIKVRICYINEDGETSEPVDVLLNLGNVVLIETELTTYHSGTTRELEGYEGLMVGDKRASFIIMPSQTMTDFFDSSKNRWMRS